MISNIEDLRRAFAHATETGGFEKNRLGRATEKQNLTAREKELISHPVAG